MESVVNQPSLAIDWGEWARVVDAAQDPNHRGAVQNFLAQTSLSGDIPAALDDKVLAPRRAAGATGEQCAYVLCNLGFAALAIPASNESAKFVMGCARLVEQLAPGSPDLSLRRHFLSAKAGLVVAALGDQPHLHWNDAAERCTAFLRVLDDSLEMLPAEAVEPNATAAFSFAAQFLSRLVKVRAVSHYAFEVGQLIETALGLADRLPSTFLARMWTSLLPGKDAGVLFRQIGAEAECALQSDQQSPDHAETGLRYLDEVVDQSAGRPVPDLETMLLIRAELLLLSGRHADASNQADALAQSSDRTVRESAAAIRARRHLQSGKPELAGEALKQLAPTSEQVLERWRAIWMGDTTDEFWTSKDDQFFTQEDGQAIWRLQAVAAVDAEDMSGFLEAANRSTGFLADSLLRDRRQWLERTSTAVESIDPKIAIEETLSLLVDGTALLQVINTPEGILTWVARKGDVPVSVAPNKSNVQRLTEARKQWSRHYFNSLRHGAGSPEAEAKGADLFAELMDEVRNNWGELLQGLADDGVTQLVLIGDDFVDIPLHATKIGSDDEYLIDRMPVTYAPSLAALKACIARQPIDESARSRIEVQRLADAGLDSDAQVLRIGARATHNALLPLASSIGVGEQEISVAQLIEGLDIPQCEIVSNLLCESTLPSTLRATGLDLSTIFLAAGARHVLASSWVVNDGIADELEQSFYEHWASGDVPAVAFQRALQGLRDQRPTLPDFYWAGMRLVGAPVNN